jgi:hypothetical protein
VDKNVDKKGTRAVAEAYLKYLYTEEGQDIAGKNFYRPAVSEKAQAKYAKQFPKLNLFTIDQAFGGWAQGRQGPLCRRRQLRPDLHQKVSTRRRAATLGAPTKNMRLVSPNQPSLMTATSMLMMSPSFRILVAEGMP